MKSMTGYGRQTLEAHQLRIVVEVRSINNRYFNLTSRVPAQLYPYEPEIKKIVSEHISRGSIVLNIQYKDESRIPEPEVNQPLLKSYYQKVKKLAEELNLPMCTLDTLVHLPDVLEPTNETPADESAWNQVQQVLMDALRQMEQMMAREGAVLQNEILGYCQKIEQELQQVEKIAPKIAEDFHQKLRSRMLVLASQENLPFQEQDILREVALFSEKADITEEIVRFKSHLQQLRKTIPQSGAIAKTIDFLLQELIREANTIASKAGNAECSQSVVSLKSWIEKIREQIQNVE